MIVTPDRFQYVAHWTVAVAAILGSSGVSYLTSKNVSEATIVDAIKSYRRESDATIKSLTASIAANAGQISEIKAAIDSLSPANIRAVVIAENAKTMKELQQLRAQLTSENH